MEEKKYSSILPTVQIIQYSYRLIGMCPYKLPSEMTSNRLPMSPLGLINTLIFVVIACTLMYFNITVDIYADLSSSGILNFISRAVLMGGLVGTILFTIASVLMRNYNWSMVRLLHKIDTRLTSIGVQFNYKRQFLMILCFTFFWLIFVACVIFYHCIYTTFGGMTYFNMGIHVVSHYMAITTYAVMMSQYFYMLVAIYSRFAALNICFGRHYLDRKAQSSKTGIDNGRVVKELRCAHDELHDLLDKVNAFLSIAAMTGITLSIFLWVLSCSAIYKRNIGDRHSLLMSPIGYVFWSSYFAFFVLTIIIIASNVKSEGRRTAVLIHKGMNLHPNHPDWDELKIFSLQLQCREPVASCGLFSYDYTLLYSVLGSISIYTTIFIQFDSFNYKTSK